MGLLLAIEGIDGSGKGTQSQRLCKRLAASGVQTALLSFPRYESTRFGRHIGEFLNGRFGSLETVHPFLASLLYAGDRFESRALIEQSLANNDVLICDRYVPSNCAHQGAKAPPEEREALFEAIEAVEYGVFGLPRPDAVILLDVPVATSQQLIARKPQRTYTDKAADLQEADRGYLDHVADVYRTLAQSRDNWHTIDCVIDGELQSVEQIGEAIERVVRDVRRES